jgi:Fe-S cluster biosynthesis and repair protein YggX
MDEIKKDQLKPYVVLGTGSLKKMEKSFEKLAKQNSQFADSFDNVKQDVNNIEQKLPQLTAIKKASEAMGSALTSKQAKGLMDSIKTNVIDQTQKVKTQVMSLFAPLDVEIKQTIDLLTSNQEVNQDKALERMEKLRKGMGIDFEKVAEAMGQNVRELIAQRQFLKEQRRQEEQIEEEKKENSLKIRDELRERGINTYLDKQTNTLKVMTLKDEKAFKNQIISDEKRLKQLEKEYLTETKEIQKNGYKNEEQKKENNNKALLILDLNKDIEKRKEEANIKPKENVRGFFADTFGQAGNILKTTFQEIGQMGSSLMKGFKNLPSTIGSFAKGLGKAALGIGIFAIKAMLVVAAILLFVYIIYKIIGAIKKVINFIKNLNPFRSKKDKEADKAEGATDGVTPADAPKSPDVGNNSSTSTDKSITNNINNTNTSNTAEENKNISEGDRITPPGIVPIRPTRIQPIPRRQENVNQMSSDLASSKGAITNQVIAPVSNNNVTNSNTTQSISMVPVNQDRSFINLNSVPI